MRALVVAAAIVAAAAAACPHEEVGGGRTAALRALFQTWTSSWMKGPAAPPARGDLRSGTSPCQPYIDVLCGNVPNAHLPIVFCLAHNVHVVDDQCRDDLLLHGEIACADDAQVVGVLSLRELAKYKDVVSAGCRAYLADHVLGDAPGVVEFDSDPVLAGAQGQDADGVQVQHAHDAVVVLLLALLTGSVVVTIAALSKITSLTDQQDALGDKSSRADESTYVPPAPIA